MFLCLIVTTTKNDWAIFVGEQNRCCSGSSTGWMSDPWSHNLTLPVWIKRFLVCRSKSTPPRYCLRLFTYYLVNWNLLLVQVNQHEAHVSKEFPFSLTLVWNFHLAFANSLVLHLEGIITVFLFHSFMLVLLCMFVLHSQSDFTHFCPWSPLKVSYWTKPILPAFLYQYWIVYLVNGLVSNVKNSRFLLLDPGWPNCLSFVFEAQQSNSVGWRL